MNPYLIITARTITIWLCACLINAMLCGIALVFLNDMYLEVIGDIFLIFMLSLFFSAPGFFIFWVILLIKFCFYITGRTLFRSALITGFVLSSVTAYFGSKIFASEFMGYALIPASCIIFSAISSIMLHFKYFKKIK
jgi:hypothetical protein